MLKVVKFGGSSPGRCCSVRKVRQIITADPARRVVVVSAPASAFPQITRLRIYFTFAMPIFSTASAPKGYSAWWWSAIVPLWPIVAFLLISIKSFLALYEKMQQGISQDELVSRGEYFAARLMAEYLGFDFLDAAEWLQFSFDGQIDREHSLRSASPHSRRPQRSHSRFLRRHAGWPY